MADEALVFKSTEEKADAISKYDESKGAEGIQKIMDAQVVPEVKTETPPLTTEKQPEAKPVPPPEAKVEAVTPPQQTDTPDDWAKSRGYASFAEARKAFDEKEELIKRQQSFIKEKLNQTPATPKQQTPAQAPRQELAAAVSSKIDTIKSSIAANLQKQKALIEELRADPVLNTDGDFLAKKHAVDSEKFELDSQLVDEISGLKGMIEQNSRQIKSFSERQENDSRADQSRKAYENEMNEIDSFASNVTHPEFKFTDGKSSVDVEAEWANWASQVASAVFGSQVNVLRSQQEREAVAHAMNLLSEKDPEVINACRVAGIPQEPSQDVARYLEICELLDHRDGIKKNPITGKKEQLERLVRDPATGNFSKEKVRFASIEDAYQHRLAVDGTYQKRIKEAYANGGKDLAAAVQKRSQAPVELDNATGTSKADVGLAQSPQDAMKTLEQIDEAEAYRQKLSGDSTLWNKYEGALKAVQG